MSPSNKVPWAEAYLHTKWHLDASSRSATIEMGRKLGRGLRPLLVGDGPAGSPCNTKYSLGCGLSSSIQPFGRNKHGPKILGLHPIWGKGRGPRLTQSRLAGPRHSSIPRDILIHAAIWPQQIWAENWGCMQRGTFDRNSL